MSATATLRQNDVKERDEIYDLVSKCARQPGATVVRFRNEAPIGIMDPQGIALVVAKILEFPPEKRQRCLSVFGG